MMTTIKDLTRAGWSRIAAVAAVAIFLAACGFAPVAATAESSVPEGAGSRSPALTCEELAFQDFSTLQDAMPQILATEVVSATETTEAYCEVTGYIAPQIEFELRLPTASWSGRYLQIGCGGFCGSTDIDWKLETEGHLGECIPPDIGEYAIGSSNSGHTGGGGDDAAWAQYAPQLKVDWGYRSEHLLANAAQAIIASFYGQAVQRSYFAGCSTGGRQALMLAQRYPDDFDGILAGSPVNALGGTMLALAWNTQANTADGGSRILTPDHLPFIHKAAVAACDDRDGLADGLISDPRACDFDPATLQCPNEQTQSDCLTPAQVAAVRKIYAGPVDAEGHRLYPGGSSVGSELEWRIPLFGWAPGGPGLNELLVHNYLRYLAAWDEPFSPEDLRFDRPTYERLARMAPIYNATDPDLRTFRDRGGKLILWHGWNDANISPLGTIAYYQAVQDVVGGLAETQEFARLYMFPGVGHCGGGTGLSEFDLLTPLVDWVEQEVAPEGVIAEQVAGGEAPSGGQDQAGNQGQGREVIRTRPVYPYPLVAQYDGSGSIDDAANFSPVEPSTHYDDSIEWVGEYRSGYQKWCTWQEANLVCTRQTSSGS